MINNTDSLAMRKDTHLVQEDTTNHAEDPIPQAMDLPLKKVDIDKKFEVKEVKVFASLQDRVLTDDNSQTIQADLKSSIGKMGQVMVDSTVLSLLTSIFSSVSYCHKFIV